MSKPGKKKTQDLFYLITWDRPFKRHSVSEVGVLNVIIANSASGFLKVVFMMKTGKKNAQDLFYLITWDRLFNRHSVSEVKCLVTTFNNLSVNVKFVRCEICVYSHYFWLQPSAGKAEVASKFLVKITRVVRAEKTMLLCEK